MTAYMIPQSRTAYFDRSFDIVPYSFTVRKIFCETDFLKRGEKSSQNFVRLQYITYKSRYASGCTKRENECKKRKVAFPVKRKKRYRYVIEYRLFLPCAVIYFFRESRISRRRRTSSEGSGGAGGSFAASSSSFSLRSTVSLTLFKMRITTKMLNATRRKLMIA